MQLCPFWVSSSLFSCWGCIWLLLTAASCEKRWSSWFGEFVSSLKWCSRNSCDRQNQFDWYHQMFLTLAVVEDWLSFRWEPCISCLEIYEYIWSSNFLLSKEQCGMPCVSSSADSTPSAVLAVAAIWFFPRLLSPASAAPHLLGPRIYQQMGGPRKHAPFWRLPNYRSVYFNTCTNWGGFVLHQRQTLVYAIHLVFSCHLEGLLRE